MKLFRQYCIYRRRTFLLLALTAGLFAGSFALYQLPLGSVLYPSALALALAAGFLIWDCMQYRARRRELEAMRANLDTLTELLLDTADPLEQDYQALLKALCQQRSLRQTQAAQSYADMVDYYTLWAHQIKTPILAMKLRLQREDSPLSRELSRELFRIEQYVELVLAFLRVGSESGDYVFRRHRLDDVLRPSLRKFSGEFIGRRLKLVYEPIERAFITDEKWLALVVEQVLSNALKYTKRGQIAIYLEGTDTLCIADTGMGIAPEDLPRIFEKGYTGLNGRRDRSASGIGLYLSSRVCHRLGIEISAQSELGRGTVVRLKFNEYEVRQ